MKTLKFLLLTATIAFISCKKKDNIQTYDEGCDMQYKLTIRDNNRINEYLLQNINSKKYNNVSNTSYHKINSEYIRYLDSLSQYIDSGELLFEGDKYSQEGKNFIARTNKCEIKLNNLIADGNLRDRLHYILNTNDIEQPAKEGEVGLNNEDKKSKPNMIYFYYLDYYFRGFSEIHIKTLLSNKKRNLLELENEFLISSKQ